MPSPTRAARSTPAPPVRGRPRRVPTAVASSLVTALALSACVMGAPPASGPAGLGEGPMASIAEPVRADPGIGVLARDAGFDDVLAELLALTRSTVDVVDAHAFVVEHVFPNGATAALAYSLERGDRADPDALPVATGERMGDEYRFTLEYAVAASELPEDLYAQITRVPLALIRPHAASEPSTVLVVVKGVLGQGAEAIGDEFAEYLVGKGLGQATNIFEAVKAGKNISEALDANAEMARALAELAAIRECVEHPPAPAPPASEQQRILDQLDEVERDLRANVVVKFAGMLTDTSASLVKAAPWLGFITKPGNEYVQTTMTELTSEALRIARAAAPQCRIVAFTAHGGESDWVASGTVCNVNEPFELSGVGITAAFSGGLRGEYTLSGFAAGVAWSGGGTYVVSIEPDAASGRLTMNGTTTIDSPYGRFSDTVNPVFELTTIDPC